MGFDATLRLYGAKCYELDWHGSIMSNMLKKWYSLVVPPGDLVILDGFLIRYDIVKH